MVTFDFKVMEDFKNKLFAKEDLHHSVRLITAIKIVSKKFCHRNFNAPAIIFTLIHDNSNSLSMEKKLGIGDIMFGQEKAHEIKEMFIKMYNDDSILLDYLNKKITDRFFVRAKKNAITKDEADTSVKAIINSGFLATFLNG